MKLKSILETRKYSEDTLTVITCDKIVRTGTRSDAKIKALTDRTVRFFVWRSNANNREYKIVID